MADRRVIVAIHYMAERAHAHRTLEIPGGSHAITFSHPEAVAHQIPEARLCTQPREG